MIDIYIQTLLLKSLSGNMCGAIKVQTYISDASQDVIILIYEY